MILLVIVGLESWNVSQYALTPGEAKPVAPLVHVSGLATNSHPDTIFLTDVYLQSLTAWQWLTLHLQSHVTFVNANQLIEPGLATDELSAQGFLDMFDSKQAAQVAALRALGWPVHATPMGAVINGVVVPSPARQMGLHVADRIVGANGVKITSACDLIYLVHDVAIGQSLRLKVERAKISTKGLITWGPPQTKILVTSRPPATIANSGCSGVQGPSKSWIGVSLEDAIHYMLPGSISIDTNYIGGPSAGLAMTLALLDVLSKGSLTGHVPVAATGTIDVHGMIGDVGGVAQKTVAVERAGAKIFFVPKVEVPEASAQATPELRIIGVSTLAEVLRDLRALGGDPLVARTPPH